MQGWGRIRAYWQHRATAAKGTQLAAQLPAALTGK